MGDKLLTGVARTAVLTLRARADEHRRDDGVLVDPVAVDWLRRVEWPVELTRTYTVLTQAMNAFRAAEIDRFVADQLAAAPGATVVELGCGLSTRFFRLATAGCRWFDLDLPPVIAVRDQLGVDAPNHRHLAYSVLDRRWLDDIAPVDPAELVVIAEGLLYYLPRPDVVDLLRELRRRVPGAAVAFDVLGALDAQFTHAHTTAIGSPIRWVSTPPFATAMRDLGVSVVTGWDPDTMLREAIERYWKRTSEADYQRALHISRTPELAERRGGVMVGRLAPL